MIWQSRLLMTLFDLAIFVISLASVWSLFSYRRQLVQWRLISAASIVVVGLLAIGLFYLVDLYTLWVMPLYTPPAAAMAAKESLHLNYSWPVMLLAIFCIFFGFARTRRRLFSLVESLESSEARLSRELQAHRQTEEALAAQASALARKTEEALAVNRILQQEVAERQRAQEEADRQRQELVKAEKMIALGTLVSGIAHEINNPNHFIMLNVPILREAWRDAQPMLERHFDQDPDFRLANLPYTEMREEIPELIEEILQGADRIKHIVAELRNYTRGEGPHSSGQVVINEVVRSALTLLANPIKKATHRFSVDYGENLPDVWGNLRRLEQVVINLILNACQALDDNHQAVRVSTGYDPEAERVLVTVEDEGRGISSVEIVRITDPFYTTKREHGGTGLGLAVAARIVEEHDGDLRFESQVGRGTVARLALPVYADNPLEEDG